ncbi:PH domain-containing protein [Sphingomonas cavernae]|uniref:YdbS-like PH domain-containing protein n=1 Tax=Sphingomonas cavernae TaxID=2320861 RepID=A0A418WPB0_9SPHN|nr:PH domain-containing protein [Sphingomonas cavernae]RJF93061.1 hypothetical protein D3876_01400 [Sphingomonas cavernae]
MTGLEPGQLWVMRIHAAIVGAVVLTVAAGANAVLAVALPVPMGAIVAPVALLLVYPVLFGPTRRFAAWRYGADDQELRIRHGVVIQVQTVVPFGRVQHIDVSQGPIERAFGVARLVLHTAGTANSQVVLPGLSRATAETLRDEIRVHIRQDLM